jgi:hypothetical protein
MNWADIGFAATLIGFSIMLHFAGRMMRSKQVRTNQST